MKYYEIDLFPKKKDGLSHLYDPIAVVKLKSITQVAKFLDTVNFDYLYAFVYTPKNNELSADQILRIWRS